MAEISTDSYVYSAGFARGIAETVIWNYLRTSGFNHAHYAKISAAPYFSIFGPSGLLFTKDDVKKVWNTVCKGSKPSEHQQQTWDQHLQNQKKEQDDLQATLKALKDELASVKKENIKLKEEKAKSKAIESDLRSKIRKNDSDHSSKLRELRATHQTAKRAWEAEKNKLGSEQRANKRDQKALKDRITTLEKQHGDAVNKLRKEKIEAQKEVKSLRDKIKKDHLSHTKELQTAQEKFNDILETKKEENKRFMVKLSGTQNDDSVRDFLEQYETFFDNVSNLYLDVTSSASITDEESSLFYSQLFGVLAINWSTFALNNKLQYKVEDLDDPKKLETVSQLVRDSVFELFKSFSFILDEETKRTIHEISSQAVSLLHTMESKLNPKIKYFRPRPKEQYNPASHQSRQNAIVPVVKLLMRPGLQCGITQRIIKQADVITVLPGDGLTPRVPATIVAQNNSGEGAIQK